MSRFRCVLSIPVSFALGLLAIATVPVTAQAAATTRNSPPDRASGLTVDNQVCGGSISMASQVTARVAATVNDPDASDLVGVSYTWTGTQILSDGKTKAVSGSGATKANHRQGAVSVDLPITSGKTLIPGSYQVQLRSIDNHGAKAAQLSKVCAFTVYQPDVAAPVIGSVDASGWQLGVARQVLVRPGNAADVTSYRWAVDATSPTSAAVKADAKGHAATLSVAVAAKQGYGAHTLYVWAYDARGRVGGPATLVVFVAPVTPPAWSTYNVEKPDGVTVPDDGPTASNRVMTLTSPGLRQSRGQWLGSDGKTVHYDETLTFTDKTTTQRATVSPILSKGLGFTFSAWLDPKLTGTARTMTALAFGDGTTAWVRLGVDASHHYFFSAYDTASKSMKTVTTDGTDDGSSGMVLVMGSYEVDPSHPTTGRLWIMTHDEASGAEEVREPRDDDAVVTPPDLSSGHLEVGNYTWASLAKEGWLGRVDQIDVVEGWLGEDSLVADYNSITRRSWTCGYDQKKVCP